VTIVLTDRIERLIRELAGGERSVILALHAIVQRIDSQGTALFDDVAICYREDYLRTLRLEGKDAEHLAGLLSLDEVREYLAKSAIPRLVELGVITRPDRNLFDPDARVRIVEVYWNEIAPMRREVADTLTKTAEHAAAGMARRAARVGGSVLEAAGW
jgi:hypothetical protein